MKSRKIFRNRSIDFNFLNFKKDSNSNWRKKRLIDNFLSKNNNIIMMIATRERLVFSSTYSHRIIGQNLAKFSILFSHKGLLSIAAETAMFIQNFQHVILISARILRHNARFSHVNRITHRSIQNNSWLTSTLRTRLKIVRLRDPRFKLRCLYNSYLTIM